LSRASPPRLGVGTRGRLGWGQRRRDRGVDRWLKGGRELLTAPGPLHHLRLALIARGDRFYERYGPVAVLFAPSWIAGIHDMRWSRFLPANAVAALTWALSIGLGAYLLGPSITDIAADAGLAGGLFV